MTDPLDTLRPEVRDALMHIRPSAHRFEINSWNCVRAELLRLTESDTDLRGWINEAEQEAGRWQSRAERAEAELAALKARIAEAPVYEIPLSKPKSEDGWIRVIESVKNERSVRGKRVRLLVDEPVPAPDPGSLDELRIERGGGNHG